MIVVSNATPLIAMAMADHFDLLQRIFGRIYIPQGVHEEVVKQGGERFGATEVRQPAWIQVVAAKDKLADQLRANKLLAKKLVHKSVWLDAPRGGKFFDHVVHGIL